MIPRTVPAAPGRVPVLGHSPALLRDPLGFLGSLAGTGELVEVSLGPRAVWVVTSPALVHELLTALAGPCPRGAVQNTLREAFGDGLLMSEGVPHRDRRRAVRPAFSAASAGRRIRVVEEVTLERAGRWRPGRVLDVAAEMNRLALEIVTRALLGVRLRAETADAFHRALPDLVKGQIARSLCPRPVFARLPLPVNRRFGAAVRALDRVVDEVVAAAPGRAPGGVDSLLSLLRSATDPGTGAPLDDAAVRSEVITVLGAGTETVSSVLTWFFHELLRAPRVHAEVLAELAEVLGPGDGHDGGGGLTPAAVGRLVYLRRVLREVLRLHAPNAFLMRTAARDVRLGPYAVPAGTELLYSLTALHRDPAHWADPLAFDPERWAGAAGRELFLPYGAGRHRCAGEAFAWMELAVVAAAVLRRWRPVPVSGARPRELVWTTVQARGVAMAVVPRAAPAAVPSARRTRAGSTP
ncbi:cytochrome P450 [Streptomyces sp. NPDC001889]